MAISTMAYPTYDFKQLYNPAVPWTRNFYDSKVGWHGDGRSSYTYARTREFTRGILTWEGYRQAQDAGNSPGRHVLSGYKRQSTYNDAYGKFFSRVRQETASLGITAAEYKQSARMIQQRANQVYRHTKTLGRTWSRVPKAIKVRRGWATFADYWLEYSFGWSPLVGDIIQTYKTMCAPVPFGQKCAGVSTDQEEYSPTPYHTGNTFYKVRLTGKPRITNPNVYLLESLGLLNPALIIWEKVRWSFVIDWLFDVGSCLRAWSSEFGLEIRNKTVSYISLTLSHWTQPGWDGRSSVTSLVCSRDTLFPMPLPNLDIPKNIGKSLTRAANALALAGQLVFKLAGEPAWKIPRRR